MKKFIFLSLSLLTLTNSFAEEFSVTIKKKFTDVVYDVTQDYDDNIAIVGSSNNYKTAKTNRASYDNGFDFLSGLSSTYGSNINLLKIDSDGGVILSKNTFSTQLSKAVSIKKTPENGYYLGGYTNNGKLLLQKLDTQGNHLFSKIFGTQNNNKMNAILVLEDGGVLAIGSSIAVRERSKDIFQTGIAKSDLFLVRFSKSGMILWSKKYGTVHDDYGVNAIEAHDGSLVVVFTTLYDDNYEVSLMRLTQNGDKMWIKTIKSKEKLKPYKLISLRNNDLILSLSVTNDMLKEQIRLIKFDLYKNILLDKKIFTTYSSVLKDIEEFANGSIVGAGYVRDAFDTDALVMLLDRKFTMLNQNHYGGSNYDEFNALKILNNSQVAVAGIHTDKDSQESNMWLKKFNSDLSAVELKLNANVITKSLTNLFEKGISEEKIEVKEDATIVLNDIYFASSSFKLSEENKKILDEFLKKFIPFLQQHQNEIERLEVDGHTSSEWNGVDFTQNYLNNTELSMKRSFSVVAYIFQKSDDSIKKLLAKIIRGGGYAYTKRKTNNGIEDKKKSRRVSFKIILKATPEKVYH